jgi:hypothetical protein
MAGFGRLTLTIPTNGDDVARRKFAFILTFSGDDRGYVISSTKIVARCAETLNAAILKDA